MEIDAGPFTYEFDLAHIALVIINIQRDFIEPGGFGETLGNDVSLLAAMCRPARRCYRLGAWRAVW